MKKSKLGERTKGTKRCPRRLCSTSRRTAVIQEKDFFALSHLICNINDKCQQI